jgi:hypothetical protein
MIQYIVNKLPKHLFWDSDLSKLDDVEHYEKIIVRAFERGDLEDMALVMVYYGREICGEVLRRAYYLHESAMLFGRVFIGIPLKDFEASNRIQHHSI